MLKMNTASQDPEDPPSSIQQTPDMNGTHSDEGPLNGSKMGLLGKIRQMVRGKSDPSLRETIEEYIVSAESSDREITSISAHERT
jgi:hypothetical protein